MSFTIIHNNEPYTGDLPKEYFPFKYPLDNFQLKASKAIQNNENVLITAHTGSGKTAVALIAIAKTLTEKKQVIYTSPIKTLSNQKNKEFSESFPDVGILTGDVKINPTAQCLIMTAEILRNSLLRKQNEAVYDWSFNPENVGCVILDEVHFINNKERGTVWEEIIKNLSPKIQLVMLSATISGAKEMADWIGELKKVNCHLISTEKRPVPLTHYVYWDNTIHEVKSKDETWVRDAWKNIKKDIDKYYLKNKFTNHIFHKCLDHLKTKSLLPATVFLLNREAVENEAKHLMTFQEDYMELDRIKTLWNKHLLKYRDIYEHTPQWAYVYDLICKGIGIHHSGMIPVLKEIVEILYNEGLLKVLLATETFALGVNSPTKTVVFSNLTKFDGTGRRLLRPEEYGQMSGRAGRRGLDDFGCVVILPFLHFIDESEAMKIMCASPQKISSKLSLDYSLILKLLNYKIDTNNTDDPIEYLLDKLGNTLFNKQDKYISLGVKQEKKIVEEKLEKLKPFITEEVNNNKEKYLQLVDITEKLKPNGFFRLESKVEKKLLKEKKELETTLPKQSLKMLESVTTYEKEIKKLDDLINFNENKLKIHIEDMLMYLQDNNMIDKSALLTIKGRVVSEINECNPLLMSKLIDSGLLDELDFNQIVSILSIFVADREKEDLYISDLDITEQEQKILKNLEKWSNELQNDEVKLLNTIPYGFNSDWNMSLSMYITTKEWTSGKSWLEIMHTYNNFEGNFIKNILRLTNLIRNILSIAKILNNVKLINKLDGFQEKLIRGIVITDSLYI